MIRQIIVDKKLMSKKCEPVPLPMDLDHRVVIKDLKETTHWIKDRCVGLAANQIGYPVRIIAVKLEDNEHFTIMVNPEIIDHKGKEKLGKEGCLSVPSTINNNVMVKRWYKIKIKYTAEDGKSVVTKTYRNFMARVIQHEIDHLEGKLID